MQRIENRQVYIVAAVLALAGIGLFLYKLLVLEYPLFGQERVDIWNIEAHVVFRGTGRPVKLDLKVPKNTRRYVIVDEAFISRGYGLHIQLKDGNRHGIWTTREANGRQDIYYRAGVRFLKAHGENAADGGESRVTAKAVFNATKKQAANALIGRIHARSSDIPSFITELFQHLNNPQPDPDSALLLGTNPSRSKRIKTAVNILKKSGVPARIVHGIVLDEYRKDAPVIQWLQVFDRGVWRSIDPVAGHIGIPDNYFTWWRGTDRLFTLQGASEDSVTISISRSDKPALRVFVEKKTPQGASLSRFSLLSLPIETQLVYRILLTIPVGAILLVLMRNVIGLKTFGTFMPVLIALAFRETQLLWGLVLFTLVVTLGLAVRFYLDRLKLLLVPRLASVLIIVVLLMASLSIISHALGLERGLSVALFPMVIMTMTIERMSIVWEERGSKEAITQAIGSLVVASLAYVAMINSVVEHLVFVFPELLLVILAATLLLGRYTGYRLTELWRFRRLAGD